ncbi:MAG: flagellar export chaperone FliS [Myxococcota bacterium]
MQNSVLGTPHDAYRKAQVTSDNGLRIVVLLYDGALGFCRQAEGGFDDPNLRGVALGRAHGIVSELLASLDHDRGGAIATDLDRLLRYTLDTLVTANTGPDRRALCSAIEVLDILGSGWRQIAASGHGSPQVP